MTIKKYWDLEYKDSRPKSEEEYVDMIDTGLRNAVKSCMIADVPIGVFLSGGIDSSLVTSYMAECPNMPVGLFP